MANGERRKANGERRTANGRSPNAKRQVLSMSRRDIQRTAQHFSAGLRANKMISPVGTTAWVAVLQHRHDVWALGHRWSALKRLRAPASLRDFG